MIAADTGEVIRKNLLDPAVFDDVLGIAGEMGMKPYIFGKNDRGEEKLLYEEPENSAQMQYIDERMKRNDKRLQKAERGSLLHTQAADIALKELININFLYAEEENRKLENILRPQYGSKVSIKVIKDIYNPGYYYLEVSNKDANKGKMLEYVSNLLQADMQDITVFGDQANDKEMFDLAGTKVAVENANEKLKAMADIIAESNDQDGVVKYLQKVWEILGD